MKLSLFSLDVHNPNAVDPSTANDVSAVPPWLETLSIIPGYLLSRGPNIGFPQVIKDMEHEHDKKGTPASRHRRGVG